MDEDSFQCFDFVFTEKNDSEPAGPNKNELAEVLPLAQNSSVAEKEQERTDDDDGKFQLCQAPVQAVKDPNKEKDC